MKTSTKSFKQGIKYESILLKTCRSHDDRHSKSIKHNHTHENKVKRKCQVMWVYKNDVKNIIMRIDNKAQYDIPL